MGLHAGPLGRSVRQRRGAPVPGGQGRRRGRVVLRRPGLQAGALGVQERPHGRRASAVAGRRERGRVGLQGADAADDGQHVRQNVHGQLPAGNGRDAPSGRHQRGHRVALGLVQGPRRADPAAAVFRGGPDESGQLRVHAAAPGRAVRQRGVRADPVPERSNVVAAQRQKRQDAVGTGREPRVRGHRRAVGRRDQEAQGMDGAGARSARRGFRERGVFQRAAVAVPVFVPDLVVPDLRVQGECRPGFDPVERAGRFSTAAAPFQVVPVTWDLTRGCHYTYLAWNVFMWTCWLTTKRSDPGYLPTDSGSYTRTIRQLPFYRCDAATKRDMLSRLCHTCRCVRPLRAKHCRLCNRCVRHFDHHCQFVTNCVGLGNRSWFFWFVIGLAMNCSYVVYLVCCTINADGFNVLYALALLQAIAFGLLSWALTATICVNALMNLTRNETINYKKYAYLKNGRDKYYNPFSKGIAVNVLEFFGCTRNGSDDTRRSD